MIRIEQGMAQDVPAMMRVMHGAFDPIYGEAWTSSQCLASLALPANGLLLAYDASALRGFALSRWVADEEELLLIGVDPAAQRQGVGAALLSTLTDNARRRNIRTIFLEVRDGNPARHFYQNSGFQSVGHRPDYYRGKDGSRFNSITMALTL